ncbi:MAG: hypothetical protein JWO56_2279 [Acidobacteria bacterium]|nr:hypothetical protein [Acidobacteriota bacterium]
MMPQQPDHDRKAAVNRALANELSTTRGLGQPTQRAVPAVPA